MEKAPDAFRTISEVAEELETPAHVLRFWESRFPQIKPVKRAGGRRYYRPADVALLAGIRQLLHTEGMTIRGVQKVLREQGVRHVASLSGADVDGFDLELDEALDGLPESAPTTREPSMMGQVVPLESVPRRLYDIVPASTAVMPETASLAKPTAVRDPARLPQPPDAADLTGDREIDGGFIAFPNNRRARSKPVGVEEAPAQATLPFETEAPEAPHVWVDDDLAPEATLHALPSAQVEDATGPDEAHPVGFVPAEDAVQGLRSRDFGAAWLTTDTEPAAVTDLAAAEAGMLTGEVAEEEGSEPKDALNIAPPLPVEGLVAGILAEEFGAAMVEEVSRAIEAALAAPDADDVFEGRVIGAERTASEPNLSELAETEPPNLQPTQSAPTEVGQTNVDPAQPAFATRPETTPEGTLLPGLATRLRAMSRAVPPVTQDALTELHSRLGLLHAQMAEAVRLRR